MSVVLLIDGYNIIAPVAAPARGATADWLAKERQLLLDRLVEHLDETVRSRTCVIFDAKDAPPHLPDRYDHQGIDVRFAVEYSEADDLLEEIIALHPTPKLLTVVSSDHRVQTAARRKRATAFDSDTWLDQLLDGHVLLARYPKRKRTTKASAPTESSTVPPPPMPPRRPKEKEPVDRQIDSMLSDADLDELIRKYQ
ncbi:NYN domain-containing protein [Aporhodopirellula aestuarii]|uniref:NYN domain-containing protein n=1 Tax=Aporhodopirellula aestuarii TaxID=2950107 RepID=A0ABT0UAP0_9BACT|nr:NYN domain-containing protein [Aporhodopirellula aestuarii]MCM2373880.1 NYN domain-containing protein [Aporhodopirellula aestuarii]